MLTVSERLHQHFPAAPTMSHMTIVYGERICAPLLHVFEQVLLTRDPRSGKPCRKPLEPNADRTIVVLSLGWQFARDMPATQVQDYAMQRLAEGRFNLDHIGGTNPCDDDNGPKVVRASLKDFRAMRGLLLAACRHHGTIHATNDAFLTFPVLKGEDVRVAYFIAPGTPR